MRCASKQAQSWGKCGLCWLGSLHLALSWIFLMASVLPWLERTQLTQCFLLLPNPSWCWGLPYSLNPASLLPPGMALSHQPVLPSEGSRAPCQALSLSPRHSACCKPQAAPLVGDAPIQLQSACSHIRFTPGHFLQGVERGGQALGSTSVPQAGRQRPAAMVSPCLSAPLSSATL